MTPAEYLREITNRLSPEQLQFATGLVQRNRNKPEADDQIISFLKTIVGGYASPILNAKPEILNISPAPAKRILRQTRIWPHRHRPDQVKIREFAELMKAGQWTVETKQPIMIAKCGLLLNGRHRLRGIIRANVPAMMPLIDELGILTKN